MIGMLYSMMVGAGLGLLISGNGTGCAILWGALAVAHAINNFKEHGTNA